MHDPAPKAPDVEALVLTLRMHDRSEFAQRLATALEAQARLIGERDAEIERLRALIEPMREWSEKATPGPWAFWPDRYEITNAYTFGGDRKLVALTSTGSGAEFSNAAFIVAAANAARALLETKP